MILKALREEVLEANLELGGAAGAVHLWQCEWIARDEGLVVIKPSGVPYDKMKPEDLVVRICTAKLSRARCPSSDLPRM